MKGLDERSVLLLTEIHSIYKSAMRVLAVGLGKGNSNRAIMVPRCLIKEEVSCE